MDFLIESLIEKGVITEEEFNKKVEEYKNNRVQESFIERLNYDIDLDFRLCLLELGM